MNGAAIVINGEHLQLRFPRGDFTDTHISGLVASKQGSTAGDVRVRPWSEARIARWRVDKSKYDRAGRHIARLIRRLGREPHGRGLVQRGLLRLGIPLSDPPKAPVAVTNCMVDGAGWL